MIINLKIKKKCCKSSTKRFYIFFTQISQLSALGCIFAPHPTHTHTHTHIKYSSSFFNLLRSICIYPQQRQTLSNKIQCPHSTQVININIAPSSTGPIQLFLSLNSVPFSLYGLESNSVSWIALSCYVSWVPPSFPVFLELDRMISLSFHRMSLNLGSSNVSSWTDPEHVLLAKIS